MSVTNIVDYVLNMKGNLEPGLDNATKHANKLEGALSGVKKIAMALGVAAGAYEIFEYGKQALEQWEQIEQTTAKLEANLQSTGETAGMSLKEIQGFASELSGKIAATRSEIQDMASQLLTFPAITKDVFQSSMGMVADIAKQTNHGLSETAIMYGKALNNPTEGLQKMMRYGVMFTDAEKLKIKQLQASGKLIESQKYMMEAIAHSGYKGVAESMFNAEPMARFNKMMEQTKETVGELIDKFIVSMVPVLESIARGFKAAFGWIEEHAAFLTSFAIGLGVAAAAAGIYSIAMWAVSGGMAAATAATWAWTVALMANPITWIVVGITALVSSLVWAWNTFEGFRKTILGVWEVIKSFAKSLWSIFTGIATIYKGIFTFDIVAMKSGLSQVINAVGSAGEQMGEAWTQGQQKGAASFAKSKGLIPAIAGKTGKVGASGETIAAPKTKAEGQKVINIHVAYNAPLISGFTISTTNIKEGLGSLKEQVSAILVGATHDSLMVADN